MELLPVLAWYIFLVVLVVGVGNLLCGAAVLLAEKVQKLWEGE